MTEKVLLNSGYKYFEYERYMKCDRFYQKTISKEPLKHINVMYYDTFKSNGAIDYDYEYELVEDKGNYWKKTHIYGLDKEIPYTIEEIEQILLGEETETRNRL